MNNLFRVTALAIAASPLASFATTYTLTIDGTVTHVASRDAQWHRIRLGDKFRYTVTFNDAGASNSSFNPTVGSWGFPTSFQATMKVNRFTFFDNLSGLTVIHRASINGTLYDGIGFSSQSSTNSTDETNQVFLKSTSSIFTDTSIPTSLPAASVFNLSKQFTWTHLIQVPGRSTPTIDTFSGYIFNVTMTTSP